MIRTYTTDINNPWVNLALEEQILINQHSNDAALFLWQNKDTVVIGRNQNPWTECNLQLIAEDNIRLARRITGGGAVFHDMGNLNFSFIMGRNIYDVGRQSLVIIKALNNLGIKAEKTGRNDMTIDGKKFSGNAFCFRGNNALHHGTILIGADKEKMSQYLTVSQDKIKAKGITSVKSRVTNLKDIIPDITVDMVKEAVKNAFIAEYGPDHQTIFLGAQDKRTWENDDIFRRNIERNSSWEWCYGESPSFDLSLKNRFEWGGIELCFKLDDGMIKRAEVYSDALCEEIIVQLPHIFEGTKLIGRALKEKLDSAQKSMLNLMKDIDVKEMVIDDLGNWLESEC